MEISNPLPMDLLDAALRRLAQTNWVLNSIEDGKLHETQVLATLWDVARRTGVDAHMVELTGSNYPLSDRDVDLKPKGYWYRTIAFLEVDGELLSLKLTYPPDHGREKLVPHRFSSRGQAKKSMKSPKCFEWKVSDEEFANEGQDHLIPLNLEMELMAARLAQKTPQAPAVKRSHRL